MTTTARNPQHEPHSLPWPKIPVTNKDHNNAAVVIVGGGVGGMCQAINLLKEGIKNFIIIERGSGFGGTWRDNRFPGCCCDVWSHLYSFSFERNTEWSRSYPGQEEILAYLTDVASKHHLHKYARFNTEVVEAKWSEKSMKWEVTVNVIGGQDAEYQSGYTVSCDYVVTAVGQLSRPKFPSIPGMMDFGGKLLHTARWDWSYSLKGKRVAVIGTGATAGQVVPEVAKVADQLTVFQRSPAYILPRNDHAIPKWFQKGLRYVPFMYSRYRASMMDGREWFHNIILNTDGIGDAMAEVTDKKMKAELPGRPDLWEKFRPNYKPGCKRPVISDEYFPTFLRDNVALETRPIQSVSKNGIVVKDEKNEELPFDVVIAATGFDTFSFLAPMEVTTRNGKSLKSIWGPSAYGLRGISAPECPNFATLFGPNSGSSHNSIYLVIEAQSRVVTRMISKVLEARANGHTLALTPTPAALDMWNNGEQAALAKTTYADPACTSWWRNKEGRVVNQYHGSILEFQDELSYVRWSEYEARGSAANVVAQKNDEYIGRIVEETQVSNHTIALALGSSVALGALYYYNYWKN